MSKLLDQFIGETRECVEKIGRELLALERHPGDSSIVDELFRLVHTLKGNTGLFEFGQLTRLLHAGEDLLDAVRDGRVEFVSAMADELLECADLVARINDGIESLGVEPTDCAAESASLAARLRGFLAPASEVSAASEPVSASGSSVPAPPAGPTQTAGAAAVPCIPREFMERLAAVADETRFAAWERVASGGATATYVRYEPEPECFYKGEDPLHLIMGLPDTVALAVTAREPWPPALELDAYRCVLRFDLLTLASREVLEDAFRYVPEQVSFAPQPDAVLAIPDRRGAASDATRAWIVGALEHLRVGDLASLRAGLPGAGSGAVDRNLARWIGAFLDRPHGGDRESLRRYLEAALLGALPEWTGPGVLPQVAVPDGESVPHAIPDDVRGLYAEIWEAQGRMLDAGLDSAALPGRLAAVGTALSGLLRSARVDADDEVDAAVAAAAAARNVKPLTDLLARFAPPESRSARQAADPGAVPGDEGDSAIVGQPEEGIGDPKYGRRAEDLSPDRGLRVLKVAQEKIDRLMELIGEMVVAKNSLPYLAGRAESQYGARDLGREIKNQYAVINRIAEEMQDAIMQVRMLPVSTVLQRFPRLVRDLSRKLGKQVELVLEGEETECDKSIIESLADPLVHVLRNSLDHGIELPEVRERAGKSPVGTVRIKAYHEGDRVVLEVSDDGRGIDPVAVKRKAFEKGLIDEARLESLTDAEAVQLVFLPGFSTAEEVSDLSGRGVGMDAVRSAVERVNGTVQFDSRIGIGSELRITLPMSMAVTNVMMVTSGGQSFGVPMDHVVETVRVPAREVRMFKQQRATYLRGRVVPLFALNGLLRIPDEQLQDDDDQLAVLVIRHRGDNVGLMVDDFHETLDIILKPLEGPLAELPGYSGTALLGNGSVLMVLNPKELMQ